MDPIKRSKCIFDIKKIIFLIENGPFWNEHLINNHVPVLFGLFEAQCWAQMRRTWNKIIGILL